MLKQPQSRGKYIYNRVPRRDYESKKIEDMKKKLLSQLSLSDQSKSIILGTLLGDGCLQLTKKYKNARLSIRHSTPQKEYFFWKATMLKEIASAKSVQLQTPDVESYSKKKKLLFQSRATEDITSLYNILYKEKALRIQRRWLNHLTPLSLAVWWCDDGSIIGSPARRGVLCTDGFDQKSVFLIARYLQKVWNIYVHVGSIRRDRKNGNYSKKEYYRLWFCTEELKKWLRIITPHIPVASMVYKSIIVYKDSQFQQRWISELKEALPQFHEQIDEALRKKTKQRMI
uniref:Putative LAGLIDADG homing endonuclease n=1 Tax=Gonatozygon brebissonii TaxID=184482 RepID=A0A6G9IF02_9VIRI|nr:putative LAGLIDADG homing endonuclease [Gonatozygon brebissonii]QIQ23042.1 putative LAGLIDADG homing endonuclease [Gonatozygon brebissonii]